MQGMGNLHWKSLTNLNELKEAYDLCDICRIKNTRVTQFTFTQQHSFGLIQRRLDYIFISNGLQEFVSKSGILNPISTDHSSVPFCFSNEKFNIIEAEVLGNLIAP